MKRLLVIGAGTAGTMVVNRLGRMLDRDEWKITIVDPIETHYYQPGFLFIPFGMYSKNDVIKPKRDFIPAGVEMIMAAVDVIEPDQNRVKLADGKHPQLRLPGDRHGHRHPPRRDARPAEGPSGTGPSSTSTPSRARWPWPSTCAPGRAAGWCSTWSRTPSSARWRRSNSSCWPTGSSTSRASATGWSSSTPRRCPGAFTKPIASKYLGDILEGKGIKVVPEFLVEHVDPDAKKLVHYDETELEYDLLVTVPAQHGRRPARPLGHGRRAELRAGGQAHLPVQRASRTSSCWATRAALPTSKSGSVAHFAVDCFAENFLRYLDGLDTLPTFDGHANCFIESGFGKGLLIDFNYDVEPLPGRYPLPGHRPVHPASGVGDEPLGQDDVPLDVLEHPAQGRTSCRCRRA